MVNDDDVSVDRYAASTPGFQQINKGASTPSVQVLWEQRGASAPPVQQVAQPAQAQSLSGGTVASPKDE